MTSYKAKIILTPLSLVTALGCHLIMSELLYYIGYLHNFEYKFNVLHSKVCYFMALFLRHISEHAEEFSLAQNQPITD